MSQENVKVIRVAIDAMGTKHGLEPWVARSVAYARPLRSRKK
jgi:hypothetical protein